MAEKEKQRKAVSYSEEQGQSRRRIAVLLPGIGYHTDKPLLYYAGRIALEKGFEIKKIAYHDLPEKAKDDEKKMKRALMLAFEQTEEALKDVAWEAYEDIVLISKSIGTIISNEYRAKYVLPARSVIFTPLEETFRTASGQAIVFHGRKDPWAKDNEKIAKLCRQAGQKLYEYDDANHSLETGNALRDLENMQSIMRIVDMFIDGQQGD